MKRTDNPELTRYILDHLADMYKIKEVREPNHLSTYVYCRTKGFFDQKQATEPTDQEVMLFALGYGLQDVLTPKEAKAPIYEMNGVIYRPDMVLQSTAAEFERLTELKTTRRSAKYHFIDEEIPETWLDYMKGGCLIRGVDRYDLIVLYMMGDYSPPFPQIYSDTFQFTQEEIDENWVKIEDRKTVLDKALKDGQIPTPYENCYKWECKYCRYKVVCETLTIGAGKADEELWE